MIISDMSYLELAEEVTDLEGGVDIGLNLANFNASQLGWTSLANAGPAGATAGSQVAKLDIASLSLSGIALNLP